MKLQLGWQIMKYGKTDFCATVVFDFVSVLFCTFFQTMNVCC